MNDELLDVRADLRYGEPTGEGGRPCVSFRTASASSQWILLDL